MSATASEPTPPGVPGVWRLMWLLFMQPIKLHYMLKAWGLERNTSIWMLRHRLRQGDQYARTLVLRLFVILMVASPVITAAIVATLSPLIPMTSTQMTGAILVSVVGGVGGGIIAGLVFGVIIGTISGVVTSATGAIAYGIWLILSDGMVEVAAFNLALKMTAFMSVDVAAEVAVSMILGAGGGIALGTVAGITFSICESIIDCSTFGALENAPHHALVRIVSGVAFGALFGALMGVFVGVGVDTTSGMASGTGFAVAFGLTFGTVWTAAPTRALSFLVEAIITSFMAMIDLEPKAARWLPFRYHDLIRFPLPGLDRILTNIGTNHPTLARQLIAEAATTIAQSKPAQRALHELQARDLEKAAREGAWPRIVILDGPFFPSPADLDPTDPLCTFIATAQDIQAAQTGGSQHRRLEQLEIAFDRIKKYTVLRTFHGVSDLRTRRLSAIAYQWADIIQAKLAARRAEFAMDPEIPAVFTVGPVFDIQKPSDVALFRIRRDLVTIIDRDLDTDRRGPLLLTGQRRMGKTSLLRMLPTHLGTTTISSHDFQQLSGSGFAHAPHRWLVHKLAATLAVHPDLALPSPDTVTDAWNTALDWLEQVDAILARAKHRVLVTIDEVERLQDGAEEGWSTLTFLDFVRAAGDTLHRIRLLLVSAHRLTSPRLGPKWADRLISAFSCRLGPLPREDAEQLLRKPVSYFPDTVFDDTTAATVLAQTGGHPYLIQAVGEQIVKRLNESTPRRTAATPLDVDRALDGALNVAEHVFEDLWRDFGEPDRTLLRALAHDQSIDANTATFRSLRDQSFLELREDNTPAFVFPLFARWIRDYQS
jgi:hypothetical protein